MRKRHGFTLVELLAVIVVLAILALIATPLVLSLIETSKKGAAEQSVVSYVKGIENEVILGQLTNKNYSKGEYAYDEIEIEVSGLHPTGGLYLLKEDTVVSGTFCMNGYEVEYFYGVAEAKRKCTGEDLKLTSNVKLSEASGYYTYPESRTIEVVENLSGGALSCESSNEEIATCEVSGNEIIVQSGTTEGAATLTIKSEETSKYKEAKAAYAVVTAKGLLSYMAEGYNGIYDGKGHGIFVTSPNAIIEYGTGIETNEDGTQTLIDGSTVNPTYEDVGEYTVYYQITRAGYNTVTGSRTVVITQAEGKVELEATAGNVSYNETIEVEIVENKSNGNLTVEVSDTNIVEAIVEDSKIKITGKAIGTTTVTVISEETRNYKRATKEYTVEVIKANNKLELSSSSGTYTYPESGTFEVIENISGGTLSCTTSDAKIATCSISGTIVTVTPGTKEGAATITIKSAATTNYNAAQVAYVAITAKGTLTSYTVEGYNGTYDGSDHGITVASSGATITYSTDGTNYTSENPKYKDSGVYTVYYKIDVAGYNTISGSEKVVINKAAGSVTAPEPKTLTYTESAQELVNGGSSSTGTIYYKLGSTGTYSTSIPTATNVGTYTVYYKVVGDKNHNDVEEDFVNVIINKATLTYTVEGYNGTYDGNDHGISVTSISGATITYSTDGINYTSENPTYTDAGTYTVYYQIEKAGYNEVNGNKNVVIGRADNTLILSSNSGSYTYPEAGTFTVTTNTSGGTLSCTTSNPSVATCSISGTTVTVTPGTTEGSATLTIKSSATTNYNEGQTAHVAVTAKGTLTSYTATEYSGTYDGAAHGITVTASGATITYSTDGTNYSGTNPTYTAAGTYTVYYKIDVAGYNTLTGNKTVTIIPVAPTIIVSDSKASGSWHNAAFTLTFSGSGNSSQIYYYYGTTSPTTKGSSISVSSNINTTYYVKACISDTQCSGNSSYVAKLDTTPPTCTSSGGSTTWTNGNITLTGTCSDTGGSGCTGNATTTFSTNTNTTTASPGTVYDNAGNSAACPANQTVKIDKTPPTCGTYSGGSTTWTNGNRTIYVTCSDTGDSGCTSTSFSNTFSSNATTAGAGITISDVAGNTASCNTTQNIYIDKIGPAIPSVTYNSGSNTCTWKNNYNYSLASSDDLSGIAKYQIDWEGNGISNGDVSANFIPWNGFNSCNVRFRAVDNAGNVSDWSSSHHIHMDTQAPGATTVTYNSGANTCTWKNNYNLTLSASDNIGIAYYEIDWHGNGTVDETTGSNFIPGNGYSTCNEIFRAVDYAGNRGPWTSTHHIHMDTQAPTCTSSGGSATWTNKNITLTGTCSDTGGSGCTGNATTTFSTNTNTTTASPGTVYDNAGNSAACPANQTVKIDKTPPTITGVSWANPNLGSFTGTASKLFDFCKDYWGSKTIYNANVTLKLNWSVTDSGGSGVLNSNNKLCLTYGYYTLKTGAAISGYPVTDNCNTSNTTTYSYWAGAGILKIKVKDNAGNYSNEITLNLYRYCSVSGNTFNLDKVNK